MRAASFVVIAALAFAAPAAASSPTLGTVDASKYPTVQFSVVTPTPSSRAPVVREDGEPVVGFEAENLAHAKNIVLAIDRSRSMDGQAIADAVVAARSFVASKPAADRISLIGFGSRALRLTEFSSATIDADAALAALTVDDRQGTALYDAVALGSRALGAESLPGRVLIVLTDGDDVSSRTTLEKAASQARRHGVAVYAIGIEGEDFSPDALGELARVTGGAYVPAATTTAIDAAYQAIAERLRRTWRVSYLTAARPGETVRVDAGVAGETASTRVKIPGDPSIGAVQTAKASPLVPKFLYENNVGTVLLALVTGSCAILAVGLLLATPGGTRLRRRLEPHTLETRKRREKSTARERFAAASGVMSATEKAFAHLALWKKLQRLIERADIPLRTVELFYICVGGGLLFGFVAAVAGPSPLISLVAMAAGGFTPIGFTWVKARRRSAAIEDQLPDILITIAASLKAGHSFRQALQAVVDEGQPPAADEFKRVLTETSLGRPMDQALEEMSERVGSKSLEFVITAVTIQRQVGGSLAGIFDMVADAVRQRQQFIRKIKGLTAMGRMSAYVLIGLPFFLGFMFSVVNGEYMYPLWHTSAGHTIVVVGLVMMAFGSLILKKIVSFKG